MLNNWNLASLWLGMVLWRGWRTQRKRVRRWWQKAEARVARQWHPKSEAACPGCCAGVTVSVERAKQAVQPYGSRKTKRGARKRLASERYACPCRECPYFGVTKAAVHALER